MILLTCCEETKATQCEGYACFCAKGACAAHVYDDRRSCYSAGATKKAQFLQTEVLAVDRLEAERPRQHAARLALP